MEKNTQYQPEYNEKFRFSSEKEQQLSAEWSSLVNKAYKILLSPIQRAEYLLKSQNVQVPEGNTSSNAEFLMEMLERNEEVRPNFVINTEFCYTDSKDPKIQISFKSPNFLINFTYSLTNSVVRSVVHSMVGSVVRSVVRSVVPSMVRSVVNLLKNSLTYALGYA